MDSRKASKRFLRGYKSYGKFSFVPENVVSLNLDCFVGIREAAERLGIHVVTARRLIREDRFPVPVRRVGNKQVVSLRRLVEHINSLEQAS